MALYTRQDASPLAGATITFTAVASSDTLVAGQAVHLLVNNASGSSITVTLVTPETVEGALAVADRAITVAAGAIREIPVPSRYNDPVSGLATVQYSAITTVTAAAVQASAQA